MTYATAEPSRRWLLLRRGGALWGVAHASLAELPGGPPQRVAFKNGGSIAVDEVLTLTAGLEVRPVPRAAALFLPAEVRGLAVWKNEPVVLLEEMPASPSLD